MDKTFFAFFSGALASDLVKAGVKEVTFSGKGFDYNQVFFISIPITNNRNPFFAKY